MSCPTCSHTLSGLGVEGAHLFWCPRCGTLVEYRADGSRLDTGVPLLVGRVRRFRDLAARGAGLGASDAALWQQLGIDESVNPPEDGPPL